MKEQKILAGLLVIMIVLSFLPSFVGPQDVYASSTTLTPSKDTKIGAESPDTNFGSQVNIAAGKLYYPILPDITFRSLVEFSDPGFPEGTTITHAYLQLYYFDSAGASPVGGILYAQRLLRVGIDPWLETHANWNRYISGSNWNTPGAAGSGTDYSSAGQATTIVPASYGWVNWDVTDQVEAAQTASVDMAFRITASGLETQGAMVYFYSREYTDAAYQPRLIISYTLPSAPTAGTIGADNVTYDSAICYGKIISEGTATPTVRGFKYGLSQTDTWDTHEHGSFGAGDYSLNLTSLIPDKTYYFRAYATNAYGTCYGSWESFSTGTGMPIVTTGAAYVYGYGSCLYASMSGTITNTGDSTVFRRGFEWGTNPITPEYDAYEDGSFSTGDYSLSDSCGANLTYWFRAYATNSEGTGYGVWKKFGTPEGPSDNCSGGGGANVTGSGTVGDPYIIWSIYGLQEMQNHLSSYWELGCSINASETVGWNGGVGFVPVTPFVGHFDGNGLQISNLYEDRTGGYGGLFGLATGAAIHDVFITEADISAYNNGNACFVGILAGEMDSGSVENVYVSGVATSEANHSYTHYQSACGGLIGKCYGGWETITRCAAYVDVLAIGHGGIHAMAGGLVGLYQNGAISDCYARGSVTATEESYIAVAGGLIGVHPSLGSVTRCYATGFVIATTTSTTGGLVAYNNIQTTYSFWDIQTTGQASSAGGTGKVTAEMTTNSTFIDAGWDFNTIWGMDSLINDGYPYLQWALIGSMEDVTSYTLTLSSTSGGNVTDPGEGDFDYTYGTVVSLNATADSGYRFALWVGDVSEVADMHDATTTVTVTDDFSIMAIFVPEGKYALYLDSTDGGSVTDPGEGLFTYDYNDIVDIEATASGGYGFVMWTGDTDDVLDVYDDTTTVTMLDDYAITANFVTLGLYALIISSTEGGEVLNPGEGLFEYSPSTVVDLTAQPNTGAWFVEWTGDVGTIGDVYDATTNITMSNDYSITAEFAMPGSFDLTIISSVGGNVTDPGEGTFVYDAGTVVGLLAVADEHYEFFAWTGDTGTLDDAVNEDTTITMNGDYVIVANFEPFGTCSLLIDVDPVEGGNITTPGQGAFTFPCGSVVDLVAQTYPGWWFSEWTGDIESIANPLGSMTTISMYGDYAITASFDFHGDNPLNSTVPDNSNNWTVAIIYYNYYEHTVNSTLVAWYQPISLIDGTTLPDREGLAQNGIITWGSNPYGVTVTLGSLTAPESTIPIEDEDDDTVRPPVTPPSETSDWFLEPDIGVKLANHPLRPLVRLMVTASDPNAVTTELQAWRFLGLVLVLFMTVLAAIKLHGHLLIAGLVCGGTIAVLVQQTIWPGWALVFIIPAIVAGIIAERTPSIG